MFLFASCEPIASTMPERIAKKLMIVGWDAADWKIIDALLPKGGMPNLKRLVDAGTRADLASLDPKLSPLLWTSIATGKTADKHGILNFVEPDPSASGLRPVCGTSRKTKALWNILTQAGLRTNLVGWYASHPAEPVAGAVVSNLFQEGVPASPDQAWPLIAGSVHPRELSNAIAELRMHPGELSADEMRALLPGRQDLDPRDPRVLLVAKLIAQCASIHNTATHLLTAGAWDCTLVFYETIDVAGHHFMQYYPPRMEHVSEPDFDRFRHVIPAVYQLQDAMLGTLIDLSGPDTTFLVLSDHGFHSDHLRPRVQVAIDDPHAAMDATWHRPLGMLVLSGPGITRGASVHGANLLDIAPTALTLLGLPIGADMDGRVLIEAIDRAVTIERVFSWDDVPGEAGQHPPDLRVDPFEARDAMKQLQDLGYVAEAPGGSDAQLALCHRETRFNLGVVYMTTGRHHEAVGIFEALNSQYPDEPRFAMNLAYCQFASGRHADSVAVMEQLIARFPGLPDAQLLRGAALFAQDKVSEAAAALEVAVRDGPGRADLLCSVAEAYIRLKRWDDAESVLARAAALDPHDPAVHVKRALLALGREHFDEAVEHALSAVELRHFYPDAHYLLGVALTWKKDYEHAIKSFQVAISMQPGLVSAHRFIASIYRHLGDRISAGPYRDAAERIIAAQAQGRPSTADVLMEPPMGPQEWARKFAPVDPE